MGFDPLGIGLRRIEGDASPSPRYLPLRDRVGREEPPMNSLRLFVLTAACAVLAAPVASVAAPAESSAGCMPPSASLVQRRVSDEAARGLPSLISFVNRTQPIY